MIRNYTSSVTVASSISFIEQKLQAFGVTDILKTYDPQTKRLTALKFIIPLNGRDIPILLPAKVEQCEKELMSEVRRPRAGTQERIEEQAARTAWKIAAEWLDIQLTMVKLKQKELLEVFLADVWNPATKQTYFEQVKERNFKALLPAKSEE